MLHDDISKAVLDIQNNVSHVVLDILKRNYDKLCLRYLYLDF